MQNTDSTKPNPSRFVGVLTDTHFWVPVVVLLGGLLLLRQMN